MSLTTAPNFNTYVDRIYDIITKSALVFPKSIGGDLEKTDLLNKVLKYEIPDPLNPPQGASMPHLFITTSKTPIIDRVQTGRSDIDTQGPELLTLEMYLILVNNSAVSLEKTEEEVYNTLSAITTTLDQNKRLADENGENPIAASTQWQLLPYLIDTEQRNVIAKNVLLRIKVYVNLRE